MNQITTFWNYFQQNNFVFLLLTEVPQDELKNQFDKLLYHLHHYNKDLGIIIKNKKTNAELIITANGNPYLFKEVELLVHHAPKINRWKTTAFLQPEMNIEKYENGTDKPLNYCGISIRISEMYFIPLENPNKLTDLGIRVLLKNYIIHKENSRLREAVYTLIEHLIGEKSFANDLSFIEIDQLKNEDLEDDCVLELYNLKFFIDTFEYD
ncbi:hypothetical protein [uncultured Flavobacterium sp.]|uniref:hypothetical protein n=1 Tax=uncultured Flavobacterium sp. TaxID=165435 RepID=UPI0030C86EDB